MWGYGYLLRTLSRVASADQSGVQDASQHIRKFKIKGVDHNLGSPNRKGRLALIEIRQPCRNYGIQGQEDGRLPGKAFFVRQY